MIAEGSAAVQAFWAEFAAATGVTAPLRPLRGLYFGDESLPDLADELAEKVLRGR